MPFLRAIKTYNVGIGFRVPLATVVKVLLASTVASASAATGSPIAIVSIFVFFFKSGDGCTEFVNCRE